jgi:glycosyltransferase involved in cell wall biosynthesis
MLNNLMFHGNLTPAKLQLVVLTRDRPTFLRECLTSIANQVVSYPWHLIVSNNSVGDETGHMLAKEWPTIQVRRYYSISVYEHIKTTIKLCSSKYLMIFHDDDLLLPGYLEKALHALESNSWIAAVACNSYLYVNEKPSALCMRDTRNDVMISSYLQLFQRYTNPWAGGAPPWSPYIYRRSALNPDYIDNTIAGKYSDISFLLFVLGHGVFYWCAEPLSLYRTHEESDNSEFVFRDKLRLVNYVHSNYGLPKRSFPYLNAKAIYYRQYFGVSPSISSLFRRKSRTRKAFAESFVSKLTVVRLWRSSTFRHDKIKALLQRLTSLCKRHSPTRDAI